METEMMDRNGTGQTQKNWKLEGDLSFYWQHYGLNQDPFPTTFDEAVYFPVPQWEHYLDLLQHLINNENVLLAVIGGEGSGKTTFASQLCQMFNDTFQIHDFAADSLFSTRKLVRELEAGFNLKAPLNEAPEEQLDAQIAEVQHKENTCLLIIDDAHFLPLETINSLLFLLKQQSRNQMRLHIILFGDKNLQAKLANLAKHEMTADIIHTVELEPFTLEETKQYLNYRLNKAGLNGEFPLPQIIAEKIYANSEGVPDKINRLAQQALLEQLKKKIEQVGSSMFKRHQTKIIGGCLLVVVLIAASYVLNKEGQISSPQDQQAAISFASQDQTVLPLPQQQNAVVTNSTQIHSNSIVQSDDNSDNANTNNQAVIQPTIVTIKRHLAKSKIPAIAPEIKKLMLEANNTKALQKPVITVQKPKTIVEASQHALTAKKIVTTKSATKVAVKSTGATPAEDNALAATLRASGLKLDKTEGELLMRNGNDFTLQVLALSNEKAMQSFIKENNLQAETHYIETSLQGKPWFILVYGIYKTQQDAHSAISSLPAALRKYQPWPRTLANVKSDMDKA